jgi:hypothetical protein
MHYYHHFINTPSLRHVSTLKGPSSEGKADTFQRKGQARDLPDVKFNLVTG